MALGMLSHFDLGVDASLDGATIYLTAADENGMMVSFIQSNYMGFGSGCVEPHYGISLQNRGYGFSLDAASPNVVAPGKRPFHTIIPAFLTKDGQPVMSYGVMGGNMQPQGHMQTLVRMLDYRQGLQAACDAPRWRFNKGLNINVEAAMNAATVQGLKDLGHEIDVINDSYQDFGAGQFIWRGATRPWKAMWPPATRAATVAGLGFCGYYLASMLDFMGLMYVSASLERLILYLNPTVVLVLSALLFKRRIGLRELGAMAVSYAGVVLVFGQELKLAGSHVALGSALVFGSVLAYAVYLVAGGEMVRRLGALRLTGAATSMACLFAIVQLFVLRPASAALVPEPVLWLSLVNAVFTTFAPVLMVMMAMERVGATLTAQCGMVGPMSTVLLSTLVLGEPFTGWLVAGTALVLLGVWLLARGRS
jgi:drug/metabolite transporter (DMT)-like permease